MGFFNRVFRRKNAPNSSWKLMKYRTTTGLPVYAKGNMRKTKNGTNVYFIGNSYTTNATYKEGNRKWNAHIRHVRSQPGQEQKYNWKLWSEY